jgi:hypothetical protein
MVFDGECIDHGISGLNFVPKIVVEAVLVDAFACGGAAEATQTAAFEGVFPEIHHPGGVR